jgi:hypothetical protein
MAKVDNNDVYISKNILSVKPAFFPADHLAGASVCVKCIIGDGKNSSDSKENLGRRETVFGISSINEGTHLYPHHDYNTYHSKTLCKLRTLSQ